MYMLLQYYHTMPCKLVHFRSMSTRTTLCGAEPLTIHMQLHKYFTTANTTLHKKEAREKEQPVLAIPANQLLRLMNKEPLGLAVTVL